MPTSHELLYLYQAVYKGDKNAFSQLNQLARRGNAGANYYVGRLFDLKSFQDKSYIDMACDYYYEAAKQNYAAAIASLQLAADFGVVTAQNYLTVLNRSDLSLRMPAIALGPPAAPVATSTVERTAVIHERPRHPRKF